jgi:lipopolysaccharide/colanic/teichoic acid biosynthesis glycosyltransferase
MMAGALRTDVFVVDRQVREGLPLAGVLEGRRVAHAAELQPGRAPELALLYPQVAFGLVAECVKRAFDLVVASFVAVVTLPLFVAIMLLIKCSSPGPIFFRQTRVGRYGRHFEIFKFRTMVENADSLKATLSCRSEADGLFKIRQDPRLTCVGRVLRQSYIDELPQLLNVLRGHMSVVGPRPLIVDEDAAITGSGRQRLAMRPGMTGEWQVLRGGGASLDEMIATDFRYVTEWSLWRDVLCLGKTALYMLRLKGW